MTLANIAYKNIKGNFNRYIMYYLSNTLIVTVFFIFANFTLNPDLAIIDSMGLKGRLAQNTMVACEVIILLFTFDFTRYSLNNFLKSREKEFGLLSLFGMTKGQIKRFILLENLIVSVISIFSGILLGVLFTKLFFMAITVVLQFDRELTFFISLKAIIGTFVGFVALLQFISLMSTFKIKNKNIVGLLKGAREAQEIPKFSKFKTLLGILFIIIGYGMAYFSGIEIILTMFPILFFTILGTYFLFSQTSIYITSKLKSNKGTFYRGTRMVMLSQVIYKLRDNAKVLFMVAIMGAITITAISSVYSLQGSVRGKINTAYPHDISYMVRSDNTEKDAYGNRLEDTLAKQNIKIKDMASADLIPITIEGEKIDLNTNYNIMNETDFLLISVSEYNQIAKTLSMKEINLTHDETYIINYHLVNAIGNGEMKKAFSQLEGLTFQTDDYSYTFKIQGESLTQNRIINSDAKLSNLAIIPDEQFDFYKNNVPSESVSTYYGYRLHKFNATNDIINEWKSVMSKDNVYITEKYSEMMEFYTGTSLFLFIGAFIGIIFFIATGSIIYFKMFNEINNDRREFIALKKIGLSKKEMNQIIGKQVMIVFFLPFIVSCFHAIFAIKALSNLLADTLSIYLLTICIIYFIGQVCYFLFAKSMYSKQVYKFRE